MVYELSEKIHKIFYFYIVSLYKEIRYLHVKHTKSVKEFIAWIHSVLFFIEEWLAWRKSALHKAQHTAPYLGEIKYAMTLQWLFLGSNFEYACHYLCQQCHKGSTCFFINNTKPCAYCYYLWWQRILHGSWLLDYKTMCLPHGIVDKVHDMHTPR